MKKQDDTQLNANKTKQQEASLQREFQDQKLYLETLKCGRKRPFQEQKEDTANARFQDARAKTKGKMKVTVQGKREKRFKKKIITWNSTTWEVHYPESDL